MAGGKGLVPRKAARRSHVPPIDKGTLKNRQLLWADQPKSPQVVVSRHQQAGDPVLQLGPEQEANAAALVDQEQALPLQGGCDTAALANEA